MALVIPNDETNPTVHVSLDGNGKAQFRLDDSPTWVSGPITWTPASGTPPLNITFSLTSDVKAVTPFLALNGTSASLPSQLGEASFFVVRSDDPKIIITPQ